MLRRTSAPSPPRTASASRCRWLCGQPRKLQGKQAWRSLTACLGHHPPATLQTGKAGWSRHQPASKVAVPADIHGGDAVAENYPSELSDALAVRNYVWKRPRYDLDPDPEREKKTPHSPANTGPAAAQRRVGPGRNRPAAVPAVARRLVEARRSRQGLAEWPQRPACDLRGDEPADGDTVVLAAREGTEW